MKINLPNEIEVVKIKLDPIEHPIAYKNRVESLLLSGMTKEQAEADALQPIIVEMYYDQNAGIFLVESEAIETGNIYNPYSGELMEDWDEDSDE